MQKISQKARQRGGEAARLLAALPEAHTRHRRLPIAPAQVKDTLGVGDKGHPEQGTAERGATGYGTSGAGTQYAAGQGTVSRRLGRVRASTKPAAAARLSALSGGSRHRQRLRARPRRPHTNCRPLHANCLLSPPSGLAGLQRGRRLRHRACLRRRDACPRDLHRRGACGSAAGGPGRGGRGRAG